MNSEGPVHQRKTNRECAFLQAGAISTKEGRKEEGFSRWEKKYDRTEIIENPSATEKGLARNWLRRK